LKKGVYGGILYIYADTTDNTLLVGGSITQVNGINTYSFARWDGVNWDISMSNPWGGWAGTECIIKYNNEIYIGGAGYANSALRKWTGTGWQHINTGSGSSDIACLAIINNELYVGGHFDSIDGVAAHYLAKYNGSTWTTLGFPLPDNMINAISYYKGELYAGGNFKSALYPNDSVENIIRYDGTNWKSVGGGMHGGMDDVNAMTVYNNELYVAGSFTKSAWEHR